MTKSNKRKRSQQIYQNYKRYNQRHFTQFTTDEESPLESGFSESSDTEISETLPNYKYKVEESPIVHHASFNKDNQCEDNDRSNIQQGIPKHDISNYHNDNEKARLNEVENIFLENDNRNIRILKWIMLKDQLSVSFIHN